MLPYYINFYVVWYKDGNCETFGWPFNVTEDEFFTNISREIGFGEVPYNESNDTVSFICWRGKRVWRDLRNKKEMDFTYEDMYGNIIWTKYFPEWEH